MLAAGGVAGPVPPSRRAASRPSGFAARTCSAYGGRARRGPSRRGWPATRSSRPSTVVDDLRLGLDLERRGAGRPGGVAAERVLLGGRDVALGAVGQLDVHRRGSGLRALIFRPGEGVDLVGDRRDAEVADPDRLELELALGLVVEVDRLLGVDLRQARGDAGPPSRRRRLAPTPAARRRGRAGGGSSVASAIASGTRS